MDRLISEKSLLDKIDEWKGFDTVTIRLSTLRDIVKAIPSAEPCEDAISRDAVLEKAGYTETEEGWCGYTVDVDYIKALPSVIPQPKTGHWKRISMDRYTTHAQYWYECDKCGKHNLGNTDYCPNCGVKMIEPQESEDKV